MQTINKPRKSFRIEFAEFVMLTLIQFLELDLEINGARCYHVLYFEVCQASLLVTDLFDNSRVVLGSVETLLLALRASYHHLAILENQRSRPDWLTDLHTQRGKLFWIIH